MKPLRLLPFLSVMSVLLGIATGCGGGRSESAKTDSITAAKPHPLPDTLRVATLYSPGSYFIYRDTEMGYDYDLVQQLARDKHLAVKLTIAPTLPAAIALLDSGKVDLLAYEVPVTAEFKERVLACGPVNITNQVLVQPRSPRGGGSVITDVTQLRGRTVTVERDSKYYHRLVNLNDEIGGGIDIRQISPDSMITDDMIELVNTDSIGLTIVDSDIARINSTYYPNLDITLAVSFDQRSAWAVAPRNAWLADSINSWLATEKPRREQAEILKRYFEQSKQLAAPRFDFSFKGGRISPYDDIFKRHARELPAGWDWRMLAAIGYTESRFDPTVVSWAGAKGLMQIMPNTARGFGYSADAIIDNEVSVTVAVKIINNLDAIFAKKVPDRKERRKFILAAYNSGHAHILDAIALADKHGMNPAVWEGNVSRALTMKSNPEYYNDPVCRYGYFRARETVGFVHQVLDFYDLSCKHVAK